MLFYLYVITNLKNEKIYIGVTNNPIVRWNTHKNIAKGGKETFPHHYQAIHMAISKYGEDNFSFDIMAIYTNENECYFAEEDWINYLRELKVPNYNIAGGGKGTGSGPNHPMFGKKLPEEWLNKVIAANRISSTKPEVLAKRRQTMIDRNWIGENHPMFGKSHSDETKQLIAEKATGKIVSLETREKISKAHSGKKMSPEHKKALSEAKKGTLAGENNPMFGKFHSEETKFAISIANKGKIPPNRKFSAEQIMEIKRLRMTGISYAKIAKTFGCAKSVIMNIVKGITYHE